jgi:hypothetical protein
MKDSERTRPSPRVDGRAREARGYVSLADEQAQDQAGRREPSSGRGPPIPLLRN